MDTFNSVINYQIGVYLTLANGYGPFADRQGYISDRLPECPCPFFLSSVSSSDCPRRGQQIRKSRTKSYTGNIDVCKFVPGIDKFFAYYIVEI